LQKKLQQEVFSYEEIVCNTTRSLKRDSGFADLGDRCLAMCNIVGFAEYLLEHWKCTEVGIYLLIPLCLLENKNPNREAAEEFQRYLS
jgi:hypothetical protein